MLIPQQSKRGKSGRPFCSPPSFIGLESACRERNSVEKERSPSPIAGLRWIRESTYVQDEPCRAVQLRARQRFSTDAELETCAVILTNASPHQDSNEKCHARGFQSP